MVRAYILVSVFLLAGLVFSATGLDRVTDAVSELCIALTSLLPVVAMMMVVVAGVIYAAGQLLGAETRARANVWATAALTGALIGILMYAIAPAVLSMIFGEDGAVNCEPLPPI